MASAPASLQARAISSTPPSNGDSFGMTGVSPTAFFTISTTEYATSGSLAGVRSVPLPLLDQRVTGQDKLSSSILTPASTMDALRAAHSSGESLAVLTISCAPASAHKI